MDNSISKALIMVASVLLAMIVIAFLTFTMNRTGDWATTQDDKISTEQKDKFNKEYEAFDKDLMYGVDVISCLNKAKSNNEQIDGKYQEATDTTYDVQVKFKINTPLTESIEVYRLSEQLETTSKGKKTSELKLLSGSQVSINQTIYGAGKNNLKNIFGLIGDKEKYINKISDQINWNSTDLQTIEGATTKIKAGEHILNYNSKNDVEIDALLSCSDALNKVVKNKDTEGAKKTDGTGWTKAVWETALYDMKTRKFTCKEIGYSETTGRVNYLYFEEIK